MRRSTAFVYDNTALVTDTPREGFYQIIAWPKRLLIDQGVIHSDKKHLRKATPEDFERFRVHSKGYLNDQATA